MALDIERDVTAQIVIPIADEIGFVEKRGNLVAHQLASFGDLLASRCRGGCGGSEGVCSGGD